MNYSALASGVGFGFLIAAQVGPIWILTLRTGIRSGFLASFGIGCGAAVIDTIYCILGALGAAAILATPSSQRFVSITGSIVIGYLGVRGVVLKRMKKRKGISDEIPLASETFFTSFRLSILATAANPFTIISWVALLAAASTYIHTLNAKITFAAGVGVGSLAFFLALAIAAAQLGKRLRPRLIEWIDQVATALFFVFALALAYRAFTI